MANKTLQFLLVIEKIKMKNFNRLNLKYEEIMQHLGNENLQYLLEHDQLKIEQQNLRVFNGFGKYILFYMF